ncbi:MAG: carbamoyltransferase [Archangium sp.]|nr:carbamoyltransferase [Archangium sp.]
MNILGFNAFGHDSAATLVRDGKIVFAVEEERLSRKKHDGRFPAKAIGAALAHGGLTLADLDHVAFFWKPSLSYAHVPEFLWKFLGKVPQLLWEQRHFTVEENLGMLNYLGQMRRLPDTLREAFPTSTKPRFQFHLLEHHLCHAASTFLCSPFDDAAILTVDGAGEWTTAMLAHGQGRSIRRLRTIDTPHSLGAFYQAVSRHVGFALIEGPGKLMGLASYGRRDTAVYRKMKELVRLTPDGGFEVDMSYFSYHYSRKTGVSPKFLEAFGPSKVGGAKDKGSDWTEHELDIASAAQRVVEDVVFHLARHLRKATGAKKLCMAGGVSLNSVTNGMLAREGVFDDIFIQPAAGDSGTSLGAALYVEHVLLDRPRTDVMTSAFLGPAYSDAECLSAVEKSGLPFVRAGERRNAFIAKRLATGDIVAWFQGRSEFGPRALGNRSILATPLKAHMKDTLNERVKFRETFRPFAAMVFEEVCGRYFDGDRPNPYMLLVYNVRPEFQPVLPAITHVDQTVRIQTINRTENPEMRSLLEAFQAETGHPVLINTSFNIKGEPMVCTPHDAVDSFARADMDYLVIGDVVVSKPGLALPT